MPEVKLNLPDLRRLGGLALSGLRWLAGPVCTAMLTVVLLTRGPGVGCTSPSPPGPAPTPAPVPPPPSPAPIPLEGLRVLIIEESGDRSKLTPGQHSILFGKQAHDYLNRACVADPQSHSKRAWWILDKDVDASGLAQHWQDALKRPRASLPWVIVSNGRAGFEGPLPKTVQEFLDLVKQYE